MYIKPKNTYVGGKHDDKHADSRRSGVGNTHKTLKKVNYETPEILIFYKKNEDLVNPPPGGCPQKSKK